MKKADDVEDDEMPAEINFLGGVRGRFAKRFAQGTNLVPIAADVMKAFPTAESVNNALRLIAQVAERSVRLEKTH